jgi:hypothetical protein
VPAVVTEGAITSDRDETLRQDEGRRRPLHERGTRSGRYAEALALGIDEYASRGPAQERDDFGPGFRERRACPPDEPKPRPTPRESVRVAVNEASTMMRE